MGLEHEVLVRSPRRRRSRAPLALGAIAIAAVAGFAIHARPPRVVRAATAPAIPPQAWAPDPPAPVTAPAAAPAAPSSKGTIPGGALSGHVTLGQAKLVRNGDGELYLHIGVDASDDLGKHDRRPIDFALVLDVSGSMEEENKIVLLRKATKDLLAKLGPEDRVAVVAFSNDARTVFPLAPLGDEARRAAYAAAIEALEPGGGTNLSAGLLAGADELRRAEARPGSARRILLMTDGLANFGVQEEPELCKLVNGLAREGVTLSTIGLGLDYGEKLLADMADAGGGSFYNADKGDRLARIYEVEVEATRALVARDARIVVSPGAGVTIDSVMLWPSTEGSEGTRIVSLGDLSAGRHVKAVLRLKVPTGSDASAVSVARVSLRYEDVRGKKAESVASESVALGIVLDRDEVACTRSAANEIKGELDQVAVAENIQRARVFAQKGQVDQARAALRVVRAHNGGENLQWRNFDGTTDSVSIAEFEVACVASSSGQVDEKSNACMKRVYAGVIPTGK